MLLWITGINLELEENKSMPQIYNQTNIPLRDKLLTLYQGALKTGNEALAAFVKQKLRQIDAAPQAPNVYNRGLRTL